MTGRMIRVGPRRPDETRDEYLDRLVRDWPRPTSEEAARLAALLRHGHEERGDDG